MVQDCLESWTYGHLNDTPLQYATNIFINLLLVLHWSDNLWLITCIETSIWLALVSLWLTRWRYIFLLCYYYYYLILRYSFTKLSSSHLFAAPSHLLYCHWLFSLCWSHLLSVDHYNHHHGYQQEKHQRAVHGPGGRGHGALWLHRWSWGRLAAGPAPGHQHEEELHHGHGCCQEEEPVHSDQASSGEQGKTGLFSAAED